ncbi:MAG: molybdopterin molybdotransferase [Frankiaceae bacterium]|nr:molybdopterin molybdotransferase [Frankiaceae bacterium]
MRSVAEHLAAVLSLGAPLPAVTVPLAKALGCVLAAPVRAATPLPPYDSSAMDGYGVRAADVALVPVTLAVLDAAPAGSPAALTELPAGACVRILTGGLVPPYVDAVVAVEQTDGGRTTVRIDVSAPVGQSIRRAGEELPAGAVVIPAGRRLSPAGIMAAAAAGSGTVTVFRRPRVAVLSTGDELVAAGSPLGLGQLPDSNGPGLAAAVRAAGGEVVAVEHAPDDVAAVAATLARLGSLADLVLSTGGVSAGAENDPIRAALEGSPDVQFVAVAMQPGKPQAIGRVGSAAYLGFPGNPVSSLVSWTVFGRPLLRSMAGVSAVSPVSAAVGAPATVAILAADVQALPQRQRYVRARLTRAPDGGPAGAGALAVVPIDGYGSHLVGGLGETDCFIEIPPGAETHEAGSAVRIVLLEGS